MGFHSEEEVAEWSPGTCLFLRKQDFFGFVSVCGRTNYTERSYHVTRAFFNEGKPESEHLPSLSAVRTTISPRVKRARGFPL